MATIIGKYELSNTSDSVVGTMKMVVNNEGNRSRRGERMKMLVDDEINRSPRGVVSDVVGNVSYINSLIFYTYDSFRTTPI